MTSFLCACRASVIFTSAMTYLRVLGMYTSTALTSVHIPLCVPYTLSSYSSLSCQCKHGFTPYVHGMQHPSFVHVDSSSLVLWLIPQGSWFVYCSDIEGPAHTLMVLQESNSLYHHTCGSPGSNRRKWYSSTQMCHASVMDKLYY